MFKIKDTQIACRYFANGHLFESKKDVRDQLVSFHSGDDFISDKDRKTLKKMRLEEILDYGGWELEEVSQTV